jgi:hypothetical protein
MSTHLQEVLRLILKIDSSSLDLSRENNVNKIEHIVLDGS